MNFFIAPADESRLPSDPTLLVERVTAVLDGPTSILAGGLSPYHRVISGTVGGERIEVRLASDGGSTVVDGSAAAAAALAWALRDLGEFQVFDEAYTVAVTLAEVDTEQLLASILALA